MEGLPSKGVPLSRVKAGGDYEEVRGELAGYGENYMVEGCQVVCVTQTSAGPGYVHREPLSRTLADLIRPTSPGEEMPPASDVSHLSVFFFLLFFLEAMSAFFFFFFFCYSELAVLIHGVLPS
jgi:hypothetical protein